MSCNYEKLNKKPSDSDYIPHTYPFVKPNYFSSAYIAFVASVSNTQEPTNYMQLGTNLAWVKINGELD